ncbi:MAG: biotin--[acetyl-CoA-carboxylase] ligase [Sedimentisphaerales bacterium]|nr:biotin--[acetyl-CoA-carboxylase] ligase [Sedimentisphaerales bacterium]
MDPEKLDVDIINDGLKTVIVGNNIIVFNNTSSTNDIAWQYSTNPKNNGLAIFAEHQDAGRGRRGNKWISRPGQSILLSVLLVGHKCHPQLLTLGSAVAIAETIKNCCGLEARIKWPNDIIISEKKAAGILLESRVNNGQTNFVIGIGINCGHDKTFFEDSDFQMPGTSIYIESRKEINRNILARTLLTKLDEWIGIGQSNGDKIIEKWRQLSSQLGHRITLEYNHQRFTGNCIGVDPAEGLILQLENGGVRIFEAAHTSILRHL